MPRHDVSQHESAYGLPLLEALMLAGFLAGFSVFLAIVTSKPSEPMETPQTAEPPLASIEPQSVEPESHPEIPLRAVKDLQNRRPSRETIGAIPLASNRQPKPNSEPPIPETIVLHTVAEEAENSDLVPADGQFHAKQLSGTESELKSDLFDTTSTVGLNLAQSRALVSTLRTTPATAANGDFQTKPSATVLALLSDDRKEGLPFSEKANCQLDASAAKSLDTYSKYLHERITQMDESVKRRFPTSADDRRDTMLARTLGRDRKCQSPEAIPALMQILQVETPPIRQEVVGLLSEHHTLESTKGLVNRAVFDLSPEVRQAANQALRTRTRRDYRPELLDALRYPWAPAAWHAAETLVAVRDKKAVPALIDLLDAPDPTMPFGDPNGKLVVRELVKVNHVQNCLLCHPRSAKDDDPVRGLVAPPEFHTVSVAGSVSGFRSSYGGRSSGRTRIVQTQPDVWLRADVTYLRQDFSLVHDLDETPSRTNLQRFDYLVRTREATFAEQLLSDGVSSPPSASYAQREAVLFALRELTGQDLGPDSKDWRRSQQLLAESW